MDPTTWSTAAEADAPSVDDLVAALPPALGGRARPPHVERDARSMAAITLMRANARALWPTLPDHPFASVDDVPGLADLAAGWSDVRAEWDGIRAGRPQLPTVDGLMDRPPGWTGEWGWFPLVSYGTWEPRARAGAPRTVELLEGIAGLEQAAFSVLVPGTFLHPHRGANTGVLRGLLGVVVDEPGACGMLVGGERMDLAEGELRVFDDCFEHAAWNGGTTERVALLLEIRRPLTGARDAFNRVCQRSYRRHAFVERGLERIGPLLEELEEGTAAAPASSGPALDTAPGLR